MYEFYDTNLKCSSLMTWNAAFSKIWLLQKYEFYDIKNEETQLILIWSLHIKMISCVVKSKKKNIHIQYIDKFHK